LISTTILRSSFTCSPLPKPVILFITIVSYIRRLPCGNRFSLRIYAHIKIMQIIVSILSMNDNLHYYSIGTPKNQGVLMFNFTF
jgi:hypothetical protein